MNKPLLVKVLAVAALAIVLLIPVAMIRDLVAERQARRDEAVAGIAEGWGKRQLVATPYIAIPYERAWTEVKQETVDGKVRETRNEKRESLWLRLPASSAEWIVDAELSEKARGIYRARLYNAKIRIQGSVQIPARGSVEDGTSRYRFWSPRLVVGLTDTRGIRSAPDAIVGGTARAMAPGPYDPSVPAGLHALLADVRLGEAARPLEFTVLLELGGSEALALAPGGADTSVSMRANWPHPSFQGRFLPVRHESTPEGFSATWRISRLAGGGAADQVSVSFVEPAGLYQRLERASKYGFLFIGLTFAALLLVELLRRLAIHPVQYALAGIALAMFFLLLTALSEHLPFAAAYAIATAACVGLITAYLVRVLRSTAAGLAFGGGLAALYALLYSLLRAEDYALLGGALLLFTLLAVAMIATRRVDWYAITGGAPAPSKT